MLTITFGILMFYFGFSLGYVMKNGENSIRLRGRCDFYIYREFISTGVHVKIQGDSKTVYLKLVLCKSLNSFTW